MAMPRRFGRLAVHEYGDPAGPLLVLLHGITDSGECWTDLVERLGPSYRIVAPDALGHGRSDRFSAEELAAGLTKELMVATTVELLGDVGPALVLGHSMGGSVAAAVAARHPELVMAAVLEDPSWKDESPWGDPEEVTRQRVADTRFAAEHPETAIARCRSENPSWPESELAPWARAKGEVDLVLLGAGSPMLGTPWREVVGSIEVPTLVVTGDGPVILRPEVLASVRGLNPALELSVVAGAGHCVRRDRGDAFHAVVDPWLSRRRPQG